MRITKIPGYREVVFDTELNDPGLLNEFIQRIENLIPLSALCLHADDCGGQDQEEVKRLNLWTVADLWWGEFIDLYEEVFKDENQLEIFE